jgi:hypothetical protein
MEVDEEDLDFPNEEENKLIDALSTNLLQSY